MASVNTLKKNKEFGFVYKRGKPVPRRDFTLIYAKSRYGGIRAGFSVSKKVGNAVMRNRARRRLKEAVRCVLPMTKGSYGVILIARPRINEAGFEALVSEVQAAFEKAGIITPGSGCEEQRQQVE